jgi:hypothetical protein
LTVNAALGDRDLEEHGQFEKMPLINHLYPYSKLAQAN